MRSQTYYPAEDSLPMGKPAFVQKIPIGHIVGKVFRNWYWLVLGALVMLSCGYFFLKLQSKKYQISASLLIANDESSEGRGKSFMKEIDYFNAGSALEDQIGVLTSYTLIGEALSSLKYGISYYQADGLKKQELSPNEQNFLVSLDSTHVQSCGIMFSVKPLDNKRFSVQLKGKSVLLYQPDTQTELGVLEEVDISQTIGLGEYFETEYCRFALVDNPLNPNHNWAAEAYFFLRVFGKN
ncbi:MAG: Wzz/FepE/Etk N-terminal domain-containing protein, partial [Bacteroidota bacterium]